MPNYKEIAIQTNGRHITAIHKNTFKRNHCDYMKNASSIAESCGVDNYELYGCYNLFTHT